MGFCCAVLSIPRLLCHGIKEGRQGLALFGGELFDLAQQVVARCARLAGDVEEGLQRQAQLVADNRQLCEIPQRLASRLVVQPLASRSCLMRLPTSIVTPPCMFIL